MIEFALITLLASAPTSPPPLPEKLEIAVQDVFAFTPPCKEVRVSSTPPGVSLNVANGRVMIMGDRAGAGTIELLCIDAIPATSEPVGADKARITCPAGTKPDVYEKATGERISSCLIEKPLKVSVTVLELPPKSRRAVEGGGDKDTNTLFLGEARVFWPSCSITRMAVSNNGASIDTGPKGTAILRTYTEGRSTQLVFCSDSRRIAIPVTVLP